MSNGNLKANEDFLYFQNIMINSKLSFEAKGLYAAIYNHIVNPDITLTKEYLRNLGNKDSVEEFENAWNELELNGHLICQKDIYGSNIYQFKFMDSIIGEIQDV